MKCFSKWTSAVLAIALLSGSARAADTLTSGKVKSVNPTDKTFVVTNSANEDLTFKHGDKVVVNRAGAESKSELKAGDLVNICYDNSNRILTANYILVQDGATKRFELVHGTVKSFDTAKKELSVTNEDNKVTAYPMGDAARSRLNMEPTTIDSIKVGDRALFIVELGTATPTIRNVMFYRAVN